MKIIAVVPTYNRPELLKKNLECLLNQTRPLDLIVLVDNASEKETFQMLSQAGLIDQAKIQYVRLDENIGASGGFKTGMQKAMELGADWIWGMDDDAFPNPDALACLLEEQERLGGHCFWSNVDEDDDFDGDVKKVKHLIFVGYFVSRHLVNVVGYPDDRFYMYHDDTDYSNRISLSGFEIVKVRRSIIDHAGFNKRGPSPITRHSFFGVNLFILNCEPYRIYYIFRNDFFTKTSFILKAVYVLRVLFLAFPKYFLLKRRSCGAVFKGVMHALFGVRGKVSLPECYYARRDW